MTMLVIFFISLVVLAFVLMPLFAKQAIRFDLTDEPSRELERLVRRKNKIYSDIKDLDFEFGIGKMAEDDYHSLRKDCVREVAEILHQIDSHKKLSDGNGKVTNDFLEKLIASKRKIRPHEVLIEARDEMLACPNCGFTNYVHAKFCSDCGAKLTRETK